MKSWVKTQKALFFALIFSILIFTAYAETVEDKTNSIISFAEDYEMGKISYLQMRVHSAVIREEVRALAGATGFIEVEGRTEPVGLTQEKVEKLFGAPIEMTNWVWSVNERNNARIDDPMPRWEKIIFDGKKIQITFNAWPQILKTEEGIQKFYWTDFDVKFKKKFDFDISGMISEVKKLGEAFLSTKEGAKELAGKMAEYRSILQGYLEQNKGDCLYAISGFFTNEEKQKEQQLLRWQAVIAEEKDFEMILEAQMCIECEWPWADIWFHREYKGPPGEASLIEEIFEGQPEKEKYKDKSIEELEAMLEDQFRKVIESAKDMSRFGEAMAELRTINKALEEAYYRDERQRQENSERRKAHLQKLFSRLPKFKEELVKEVRFERRLVEDLAEKKEVHCREIRKTECGMDEGCYNGDCVYALGGKEHCGNKEDDDGDQIIDCKDPDCARQCGRVCKPVCEQECWPCNNRECGQLCKECWECKGEGCEEGLCKECWPCTEEKCRNKPFCAECKACEDSLWQEPEDKCDRECEPCEECVKKKEAGEQTEPCGPLCEKCEKCRLPVANQQCIAACNEIGKKSPTELIPCKKMCEDKVVFFCGTSRQNYPCKDTTYICEGKAQYIPCFVYDCKENKQTVPCTEEAMCGLNQFLSNEKQCKCQGGYYDCDKDNNCESIIACKEGGELCDNQQDDDGDYLTDCEDLMDCRMKDCENNKVCFEGRCVPSEEVNLSELCPKPDEEYFEGKCIKKCPEGYEKDEQGVCKPVIVGCPEGYELKEGICVPREGNMTCPEGFKPSPEKPGECIPIVVECPKGYKLENEQCIPIPANITCEEGYILEKGGCVPIVTECPNGYKLENNRCVPELTNVTECPEGQKLTSRGECVPIEVECPEGYEKNEEGVCVPKEIVIGCPKGFILIRDECLPQVEECPARYKLEKGKCVPETPPIICIGDYALKNGKCVPIIFECPENYKLKDGVCVPIMVSCPEGEKLVEDTCVPERCPEGEKFEEGKCAPLKKEEEGELRNTGEECVLENDCSGENDICSNGICKELPKEIMEEKPPEEKMEAPPEIPKIPEGYEMPEAEKELEIPEGYKVPEEEGFKGGEIPGYDITEKTVEEEKPEEKPPTEMPPEVAPEGGFLSVDRITGFFSKNLLGFYFKRGDKCSSDEDCNPNQQCAPTGECHCKQWEGWFDCNGDGDGYDGDGCESNDPTCGGKRELCPWGCKENQYCNEKTGNCECNPGFFECNGDWLDGCESNTMCKQCVSNEDCAPKRCVEWEDNIIMEFGCYEEAGWIEEKGAVAFSGGCNFHPTGKVDSYMGFDAWGETFDQVSNLARQMEEKNRRWCKFEIESLGKERGELEASMNKEFLKWFFEDYVNKDTANWEKHISGIFDAYWKFVDNSQRTAEMLKCEGLYEFPTTYNLLGPVEYSSELGEVKFWEEKTFAREFGMEVVSPYMQIWVFPPKEFIKEEMRQAAEEGRMPGPPEESQPGPSPADLAKIREDPDTMEFINKLSNKHGGSADTLITIAEEGNPVFNVLMRINPQALIEVKPVKEYSGTPNIKVNVDFDFVYEMISISEKSMQTERPPWDNKFRVGESIKGAMTAGKIFSKIVAGIASGSIKIEPISALPDALKILKFMLAGPPEEQGNNEGQVLPKPL